MIGVKKVDGDEGVSPKSGSVAWISEKLLINHKDIVQRMMPRGGHENDGLIVVPRRRRELASATIVNYGRTKLSGYMWYR